MTSFMSPSFRLVESCSYALRISTSSSVSRDTESACCWSGSVGSSSSGFRVGDAWRFSPCLLGVHRKGWANFHDHSSFSLRKTLPQCGQTLSSAVSLYPQSEHSFCGGFLSSGKQIPQAPATRVHVLLYAYKIHKIALLTFHSCGPSPLRKVITSPEDYHR